jgi:hypothetical protein
VLGSLSPRRIEDLLKQATVGRIGVWAEGRTYVVPVTYVYDGDSVYGHSVLGKKVRMMRLNPEVCFEVEDIVDMANWRTVIASGRYEELTGDLAVAAARLIAARLGPLTTSRTAGPSGHAPRGAAHVSYRIRLISRSGRFERQRRTTSRRKAGRRV